MATARITRIGEDVNGQPEIHVTNIVSSGEPHQKMLRIAKALLVEQKHVDEASDKLINFNYSIVHKDGEIRITCEEIPELHNLTPQEYVDYIDQAMLGVEE